MELLLDMTWCFVVIHNLRCLHTNTGQQGSSLTSGIFRACLTFCEAFCNPRWRIQKKNVDVLGRSVVTPSLAKWLKLRV